MKISQHAMKRMTQRAIKMSDIELILALGTIQPRPGGAVEYFVKREKISFVINELKHIMNQVNRLTDKAILITDNKVKTVYHKHN
ncbi:MAG: hypothetical protein COT43_02695 [Candidatus Marinimicrobia bacterium CG08_land_8_20_14_0_20_45_22]|nr:MAG: hypothetical protein COT43_02695 [Candidatus Marinimicrobia bacterium CG08_land_8_20_14_0_20_45_22]